MATRYRDLASHVANTPDIEAILRQFPVGVLVAEAPGGRVVSVNEKAEQLWQGAVPEPESVAEYSDWFVGFRPDGRQYESDEWPLARAVQHGEVVTDEEIACRVATGARRVFLVSAAPVRNALGDVVQAVALFEDVTEQRQEERRREFVMQLADRLRALNDAAEIMRAAVFATCEHLGVSSVSYADVDPRGRYALVHAEYRNGRQAPPGKYSLEDFGPDLVQRIRAGHAVALEDIATDAAGAGEIFDGWGIRSLVAVPLIRDGALVAIFTVMHTAPHAWTRSDRALVAQVADRTWYAVDAARVRAELRQSREWLALALGAGSAAIWEWDLPSGHIHWSEENGALLGFSSGRRTLTFERWLALVHQDDRPAARAASRRVATMRDGEIEFEHRVAGVGEPRWITMRGRIILGTNGAPRRVVGVAVDSTERKRTELEREALLQQAREASEAKSHFISVISHEFRTPLTAIIGYSDLLSTGVSGALSPTQSRQLDRIRASAWHLTQMVDEILTFSRIEAGRESIIAEPADVLGIVREAVSLVGVAAAEKGLALACELPDAPINVTTDPGKLRQVMLNLLGNAVKFTEQGGITVRVRVTGDGIEYSVADTGIGIAAEHQERIFDRFWQVAQEQNTRTISGAGLGLTVSRHLVALLGGELSVESEPGRGSTFRFLLPTR
jgi:PAS domain S-box-containing protein